MTPIFSVTIPGRSIGKKNAKKLATRAGKTVLVAKKEWVEFHKMAMKAFLLARIRQARSDLPRSDAVSVRWSYYPPNHVYPDWSAICETVGDLLEMSKWRKDPKTGEKKLIREGGGIIRNDKQIRNMDGSRIMEIDKGNPRIVIEVYPHQATPGELEYRPPKPRRKRDG